LLTVALFERATLSQKNRDGRGGDPEAAQASKKIARPRA